MHVLFAKKYIALLASSALSAFVTVQTNAQQIILDGRTNTRLDAINPTTTTITTTTISGGNGINSFKRFNVDIGNTVNLVQPINTNALINIVTGNDVSNISGILNAFKNGQIGGNSVVANTNGIVVGKDGVINAGHLTLTTPSREYTDGLFLPGGGFDDAALGKLLSGGEALNSLADISVHGRIDAEGVAIRAGRDIKVDGVIHSRFGRMTYAVDQPNSSGKKSARVQAATGMSVSSNGVVKLFAGRNAQIKGQVKAQRTRVNSASSSNSISGGDVYLYAAQDLTVEQQALIDVSGTGDGDAGTALLFAGKNASLFEGALITADAESGDAGFVEFSADKSVDLSGSVQASSNYGFNGTIFIDPEDLTISSDRITGGANLVLTADKTITIEDDIEINTNGGHLTLAVGTGLVVERSASNPTLDKIKRDIDGNIIRTGDGVSIDIGENVTLRTDKAGENSGDITLYAPQITVGAGSIIRADASGLYDGGKIELTALREQLRGYNTTDISRAFVHITDAVLTAREINISAEAFSTNLSKRRTENDAYYIPDTFPPTLPSPPSVPNIAAPEVPDFPTLEFGEFGPQFKLNASAEVVIKSSTITTQGTPPGVKDLSISSFAETDVALIPKFELAANLSFQELAGLNLGVSDTASKVDIQSSTLNSANDLQITSSAKETHELTAIIKQNDGADAIGLNLSLRDLSNQILLHPDTKLTAGRNIFLDAITTKDISLSSSAEVQPHSSNNKLTALASNLSIGKNHTELVIAADLNAGGSISAVSRTIYDNYVGSASAFISGVNSRERGDSTVIAAQVGIRKYVSALALRLFDIDLNENKLLSDLVVKGVEEGIDGFSFAGALDISEEQDTTISRIGVDYRNLNTDSDATFLAPVNPIQISAKGDVNIKSLMSYGGVDANDNAKGVIAAGQAIRKRAEAGYKAPSGSGNPDNSRLLDGTITIFEGQTITDIAETADIRSNFGAIKLSSKVQYPQFNTADFRNSIDSFIEDLFQEPQPIDGGYKLEEPKLELADPRSDYFTTFARAQSNTPEKGYALNGTYFAADNKVETTVKKGAKLVAATDINVSAVHQQETLHVTNLPLSSGTTGSGIGGSFSFVQMLSSAKTSVENDVLLEATNIDVLAINTGALFNNTYSHAQSQKSSVNGALANSIIDNDTIVEIGETANLNAIGTTAIQAEDDLNLWTIGGALGRSNKTGVGIGSAKNTVDRTTIAAIGNLNFNQALLGANGNTYISSRLLDIDAINSGKIIAGSAGAGAAGNGGAAIAGSISDNSLGTIEAVAGIRTNGELNIGIGGIDVDATTDIKVNTLAGAIGINGDKTLAGAVANLDVVNFDTRIYIYDATLITAAGISANVNHSPETFQIAGGGSIKGSYAGAGSLAISEINGRSTIDIINASLTTGLSSTHNVIVEAIDSTRLDGGAGVLTYARSLGLGTSLVHNSVSMLMQSTSNNSDVNSNGVFNVGSKNNAVIRAIAAASAGSLGTAASVSITINNVNNGIKSSIINGTINALSGVEIKSDKETEIKSLSGAISGSKDSAVGVASAINAIYDDVSADLLTANLITNGGLAVVANNKAKISTISASGSLGNNGAGAGVAYSRIGQLTKPTVWGERTDQRGVSDNNNLELDNALQLASDAIIRAKNEALDLKFTVGLVADTVTDGTEAGVTLQGANVQSGSIFIRALDQSEIESLAGGVGLASTKGGGAAFSLNNYGSITNAHLRSQGVSDIVLTSPLDVSVIAEAQADIKSLAASLGAAGTAGIAGSASLNLLNGSAMADISGIAGGLTDAITITDGSVFLKASQSGTIENKAGAVGAGKSAGLSGAVAVNLLSNDATAKIENVSLDVDPDENYDQNKSITVDATVTVDVDTIAGSAGAAGSGAFAGSVSVNTFESNVLALANGALLDADGNITFDARNDLKLVASNLDLTGAPNVAAAGTAALGAAVFVNDIGGTVQALSTNSQFFADSLSFDAVSISNLTAKGGAAAAAGTAAFNAAFAQNNLTSIIKAQSVNSRITSGGNVNFTAKNESANEATLISVSVSGTVALGASAALAENNANVTANMKDTFVSASDGISVETADKSTITAQGLAVAASTKLSASGIITTAKNAAKVTAKIDGDSSIVATNDIIVKSTADSTITTSQAAAAGGLIGAGLSHSTSANEIKIESDFSGNGSVSARHVLVSATDQNSRINAEAGALALGGAAIAGAKVDARNVADIDSSIGFGRNFILSGDASSVASGKSIIDAKQISVASGGLISAGAVVIRAENNSNIDADISATSVKARNITIDAKDEAKIDASGFALSAGFAPGISASAADILAQNNAIVKSAVGDNSNFNASEAVSVRSATIDAASNAKALQVSIGAVSLGLSTATSKSNNIISTNIGNGAAINADSNITISSNLNATSSAISYSVVGGAFGIGGAKVEALDDYSVTTNIGNADIRTTGGSIAISSEATTTTKAEGFGADAGLVAGGSVLAVSGQGVGVTTTSMTTIGGGATIEASNQISLAGSTTKYQTAGVVSGGGGGFSSRSGEAKTRARSNSGVIFSDSIATDQTTLLADSLNIDSNQQISHTAKVDNINASVVGQAGGRTENDTAGNSEITIGTHAQIASRSINIKAKNDVRQNSVGNNVQSRSGGLYNGAASEAKTNIDNTTSIIVKDDAVIEQYLNKLNPGNFNLGIENSIYGRGTVNLDSGGAIAIARSSVRFDAKQNNQIRIGDAKLYGAGDLRIFNRSDADIRVQARSTTYGFSGSAQADSNASFTSFDNIILNKGADVEGTESVNIGVGTSPSGDAGISVSADTRLYNRTLIPVETQPTANASVNATRKIDIQDGAIVQSGKDVSLFANKAKNSVSGYGLGKDLWQEIYNETIGALLNFFFDVALPLELRSGTGSDVSTSTLNIAGTVIAGNRATQLLTIDETGAATTQGSQENVVSTKEGITFTRRDNVDFVVEAQAVIDQLTDDIARLSDAFNNSSDATERTRLAAEIGATEAERDSRQATLDGLKPPVGSGDTKRTYIDLNDIQVDEGDIIINAANITAGANGRLQANGNAEVKILIEGNQFLTTSDIIFGDKEGGNIFVNNTAVKSATELNAAGSTTVANGFVVAPTMGNSTSKLIINNLYSDFNEEFGPDIILNGEITNRRGSVDVFNTIGSIESRATITAATFSAEAPNGGFIQSYKPGVNNQLRPQAQFADLTAMKDVERTIAGTPRGSTAQQNSGIYDVLFYDSIYSQYTDNIERLNQVFDETIDATEQDLGSTGSLIFGQKIFISSEYVNINGLIQSGSGVYDLGIGSGLTQSVIDNFISVNNFLPGNRVVTLYDTNPLSNKIGGVSGNMILRYDRDTGRLIAQPALTRGGQIDIYGNIISTGNGTIRAFDGFGQLDVVNNSNFDLQLEAVSTGAGEFGAEGIIRITDTGFARINVPARAPGATGPRNYDELGDYVTTTFTYKDGQTIVSTNQNGGQVVDRIDSKIGAYNPIANRQYVFRKQRLVDIVSEVTFKKELFFSTVVDNTLQLSTVGFVDFDNGNPTIEYGMQDEKYRVYSEGLYLPTQLVYYDPQDSLSAFATNIKAASGYTIKSNGTLLNPNLRIYTGTTRRSQFIEHRIKADYPIKTEFFGGPNPGVNITSNGTGRVLLNGSVINSGPTNINAIGSIQTTSDQVLVNTGIADINSQLGSVTGSGNGAFNFELNDNAPLKLTAGKNINIHQFANNFNPDGNIEIGKIHYTGDLNAASTPDAGNVTIRATGDINGVGGEPLHVRGNNVNLFSDDGGINAGATPLRIATGQGTKTQFNASATNDINIIQPTGDLKVGLIESRTGSVILDNPMGRVLDANINEVEDTQTVAQLTKIWEDLGLLDDGNDNIEQRIKDERKSQYAQYWDTRNRQSDPTQPLTFTLTQMERDSFYTAAERQSLRDQGLTDLYIEDQIDAYVSDTQILYNEWNLQSAYNDIFEYVLRTDELKNSHAEWTLKQLRYGIPNTLDTDATDTTTKVEAPNIIAKNDISISNSNGIGTFEPDLKIEVGNGDLFDDARNADAIYLSLLTAEEGDTRREGNFLYVRRADDVDVTASGKINLNAGKRGSFDGDIFLGSEEVLNLERLSSEGEIRVTTTGDIFDVAPDNNGTVVALNNILLESAKGSIGKLSRSVRTNTNDLITARAGKDIFIVSQDDLNVGRINAGNYLALKSENGNIFDGFGDGSANLRGIGFDIDAANDIGSATDPLELIQDAGDGVLRLKAKNAFIGSETSLTIERWDTSGGIAELQLQGGNLKFATQNGETGLSSDLAEITVPGLITDNNIDTLAIEAGDLTIIAGGVGEVVAGVENRLNINVDEAKLSAASDGALFRINEKDSAIFGTLDLPLIREIHLGTGRDLTIRELVASDLLNLDKIGGDIFSGRIEADRININALGTVGKNSPLQITTNDLTMSANRFDLDMTDLDPSTPLQLALRGPGGVLAERVDIRIKTTGTVNINELRVERGDISTTGPRLTLKDATISENVWFRQAATDLFITNKGKFAGLSEQADIQAITEDDGSVEFNLRDETKLFYTPHILHHRQPFLTLDSVGDFSITAYEVVSTRSGFGQHHGQAVRIAVTDAGGVVVGNLILRFPIEPDNEIDPREFITGEEFLSYIKEKFGGVVKVKIAAN